jgi:hypothetical protein
MKFLQILILFLFINVSFQIDTTLHTLDLGTIQFLEEWIEVQGVKPLCSYYSEITTGEPSSTDFCTIQYVGTLGKAIAVDFISPGNFLEIKVDSFGNSTPVQVVIIDYWKIPILFNDLRSEKGIGSVEFIYFRNANGMGIKVYPGASTFHSGVKACNFKSIIIGKNLENVEANEINILCKDEANPAITFKDDQESLSDKVTYLSSRYMNQNFKLYSHALALLKISHDKGMLQDIELIINEKLTTWVESSLILHQQILDDCLKRSCGYLKELHDFEADPESKRNGELPANNRKNRLLKHRNH